MKLTEIIFLNDVIQKHRSQGAKAQMIMVRDGLGELEVNLSLSLLYRRVGTSSSCSVHCTSTVK